MSKIHETAVAMRECLDLQKLADARTHALDAFGPKAVSEDDGLPLDLQRSNAQQVLSDATSLLTALEQELGSYTPETPADMLTQILVISEYFHAHALDDEDSTAHFVVKLLIGRLLEGLINLAGRDSSPIFDGYFLECHTWAGRVAELKKPVSAVPGREPVVVRVS
jgi:hypothetical protein